MTKKLLILALAGLVLASAVPAGAAKKNPKEPAEKAEASEEEPAPGEKKKKKPDEKPFAEVVEGFEVIEGLFTFYRDDKKGSTYLEIRPEQFDRIFLCSLTREAGDGYFFDSGAMLWEFPFVLKRVGKKVQFIHKNVYFRAEDGAAIGRAIGRGLSDSIVGDAKIVGAPHPERGSILVDAAGFFVQDVGRVGFIFKEFIQEYQYSFDRDNSSFGAIKSFPQNSEIDVVLHFKTPRPLPVPTLPDASSFLHTYRFSLSTLPESGFRPRLADDRVGHFLTMYQDYTSQLRDTPYVRYVNRWHLEKAEPKFEKSKPRQPIVFWLENTIPVEHRDAVREGILLWNSAFERIGFKEAIEVRQQPDDADWDPADVRYNTVRWIVRPGGGYAVGPSRTNPFTGQIYDADIRVSSDMLRFAYREFEELADPVTAGRLPAGDAAAVRLGLLGDPARGFCDHQRGAVEQAAFGWSVLSARAAVGGGEVDLEEFLRQFIVEVIAHEVGHTLGLRHNFKASTIRPGEELHDTGRPYSGSVMDYNPVNLAAEGRPQGLYYQTMLGPYDYWAIEYAYTPVPEGATESEAAMLERIASRVADPLLRYGTDEDAFGGPRGLDPTANRWDLGADPVEFYGDRVAIARELWGKMEERFETPGERYPRLRQVFFQGLSEYFIASFNVTKYVGGVYHYRDHVGDPGGRLPFAPVSATRQREALRFLHDEIFGPDAFAFPPSLLNKLAPERLWDFTFSIFDQQRLDLPLHDIVRSIQAGPLNHLFHPLLMSRMIDLELRRESGDEVLTLAELFGELRESIWAELESGGEINSFRRELQRMHLDKLVDLVIEPPPGAPEDASTLARADLVALRDGIRGSLPDAEGAYTRAHLQESLARAEAALAAGLERRRGSPPGV